MSEAPKIVFTSLPREIRDCIYRAALVNVSTHLQPYPPIYPEYHQKDPIQLGIPPNHQSHEFVLLFEKLLPPSWSRDLSPSSCSKDLLLLAHQWASVSTVAQEAYAAYYMNNIFMIDWQEISQLAMASSVACQDCLHSACGVSLVGRESPIRYLRDIMIDIESQQKQLCWGFGDCSDPTSILASHPMKRLLDCPKLRKLDISISVDMYAKDTYIEALPVLMGISPICKDLQKTIGLCGVSAWCPSYSDTLPKIGGPGPGLRVCLLRTRYLSVDWYDITWMWDPPDQHTRERVGDGRASSEEVIRVLIADGRNPGEQTQMLESLQEAARTLRLRGEQFIRDWDDLEDRRVVDDAPA